MIRYVIGFEPVARASTKEIVALVAPTSQRYLANPDLGDPDLGDIALESH